jgi:hypothetical protein
VTRTCFFQVEREAASTPIHFDNSKARQELGVVFRPLEDTVRDGINSIVGLGYATLAPPSRL